METESKWICFVELAPNSKTKRWDIVPKQGGTSIGVVKWYGPWRKYCFFPESNTVLEEICLSDIGQFCANKTNLHRTAKSIEAAHARL